MVSAQAGLAGLAGLMVATSAKALEYNEQAAFSDATRGPNDALTTVGECLLRSDQQPWAVNCSAEMTLDLNSTVMEPLDFSAHFGAIINGSTLESGTVAVTVLYGFESPELDFRDVLSTLRFAGATIPEGGQGALEIQVRTEALRSGVCLVEAMKAAGEDNAIGTVAATLGLDACVRLPELDVDSQKEGARFQLEVALHALDEDRMTKALVRPLVVKFRNDVLNITKAMIHVLDIGTLVYEHEGLGVRRLSARDASAVDGEGYFNFGSYRSSGGAPDEIDDGGDGDEPTGNDADDDPESTGARAVATMTLLQACLVLSIRFD